MKTESNLRSKLVETVSGLATSEQESVENNCHAINYFVRRNVIMVRIDKIISQCMQDHPRDLAKILSRSAPSATKLILRARDMGCNDLARKLLELITLYKRLNMIENKFNTEIKYDEIVY